MREQALWRAVLRQAIDDLKGRGDIARADRDVRQRARAAVSAWLGTRDFHTVCEMAGLEPAKVRRAFLDTLRDDPMPAARARTDLDRGPAGTEAMQHG